MAYYTILHGTHKIMISNITYVYNVKCLNTGTDYSRKYKKQND